jgi:hypothetical protein
MHAMAAAAARRKERERSSSFLPSISLALAYY